MQAGAEISVIANDDEFDETETVVYFFRQSQREKAQRLLDSLGTGTLVKDTALSDNVDAVVVLGQDYIDLQGGSQPVDHGPRRCLGAHHRADRWRGQRRDPRWRHARCAGG